MTSMISSITENCCYFFSDWPYEDSLLWLDEAHRVVNCQRPIILACGSHKEAIVTIGRNAKAPSSYNLENFLIRRIDRGGGATIHEPGQLVLYPVIDLASFNLSVKDLVIIFEIAILRFLEEIGLMGNRSTLGPGVFIGHEKIGFIGFRVRDGKTSHGCSINVKNDAKLFSFIDPCGIKGLRVTSARFHTSVKLSIEFYQKLLARVFLDCFKAFLKNAL